MIITQFKNISDLNNYLSNLFLNDSLAPLNSAQAYLFFNKKQLFDELVRSFNFEQINSSYILNNLTQLENEEYTNYLLSFSHNSYYIYFASKTRFINNVINDLIPSLSKTFYKELQNNGNVLYASTQYSLYTSVEFSDSSLTNINSALDTQKAVDTLAFSISSNSKDVDYLITAINYLQEEINSLNLQIANLSNQVVNSSIMTWS